MYRKGLVFINVLPGPGGGKGKQGVGRKNISSKFEEGENKSSKFERVVNSIDDNITYEEGEG